MKTITIDDVLAILNAETEDEALPAAVLQAFKEHAGKRLTKHFLKHLPGGEEVWRITSTYIGGQSKLETWTYCRSQGREGISFYIAPHDKNVIIDPDYLLAHNYHYYTGRIMRNMQRSAVLGDLQLQELMVMAINRVREAKQELKLAQEKLSWLTVDPSGGNVPDMFTADRHVWQKMAEGDDK